MRERIDEIAVQAVAAGLEAIVTVDQVDVWRWLDRPVLQQPRRQSLRVGGQIGGFGYGE